MKVAILLSGYLDSPDYLHIKIFAERLTLLGYKVICLDPCNLWNGGDISNYTITNYVKQVEKVVNAEAVHNPEDIIVIGHSLGGFVAILAGQRLSKVTKIVALCPPATYENSLKKWKGVEVRHSKRELPDDPTEYRYFDVPKSFAIDAQQYSAIDVMKNVDKPTMIFIGLEDTVVPPRVTEQLVTGTPSVHAVRLPGIGHDFRKSREQSEVVMREIEKFLS